LRLRILALAIVASLLCCATASAATLHVTSEEEGPGSLGETILEAGPGDTIEIPPGQYLLENGDTMIAQHNILRGAGVTKTTVIPSGGGEALNQISYSGLTIGPAKQAPADTGSQIETQAQIIALIATLAIFGLILELVRRRRLVERYALLWMAAAVVLLVLAIWSDGLDVLADAMGIKEPANAIFILCFGVIFLLLLNFSVATSRLSEETKILAQESGRLEQELRAARGEVPTANGDSPAAGAEQPPHERPVGAEDET
jgi:hypothetical protein